MKDSLKQDFTRRLSQCNRGGMIVIIYDIFFAYEDDARSALQAQNWVAWKQAIHKMQETLDELIYSLDFSYKIAGNLYQLYSYFKVVLAKLLYTRQEEGLTEVSEMMHKLYLSFCEAAKQDQSKPLMSNTQQVYAGMTYGRSDLNENYMSIQDTQRGFFA